MDVCILQMLYVVRYRSLLRADHPSRGVLPTVVCNCVWSRNFKNESALARVGLLRKKKKTNKQKTLIMTFHNAGTCSKQ
jgi:hypothetical protein